MTIKLTICITCRLDREASQRSPRSDGVQLAERLDDAARNLPGAPSIVRHQCLWACAQACAILIQAEGKTGYLAGRFEPTAEAASALLEWAAAMAENPDGSVGYVRWPQGMKGHFIARIPE